MDGQAATASEAERQTSGGTTMRAVRLARFGGPEVLEVATVPIPQPTDDEVLVRVRAASINPVDLKTRSGEFPPVGDDDLPLTLGRDCAGTIETMGTRAHYMVRHGDRVFAHVDFDRGAQAEYVVVRAVELVAMPDALDFATAGAVGLAAMTAWQALFDHGALRAGQRVLVHGGAGGVGHLAVQFARARGAEVVATAGSGDLDFVRRLGATQVVDYRAERFEQVVEPVDLVIDLVGGDTQARSLSVLREGGTLVSTIAVADDVREEAGARGLRVAERWMATPNAEQLGEVAAMLQAGTVTVTVSRSFALEDVAAAHAFQADEHPRGKVVLLID